MPPVPSTREIWSSLEEVIGARGSQGVEAHVKCLVLLIYPPLPGFPPVLLVLLFRLLQKVKRTSAIFRVGMVLYGTRFSAFNIGTILKRPCCAAMISLAA